MISQIISLTSHHLKLSVQPLQLLNLLLAETDWKFSPQKSLLDKWTQMNWPSSKAQSMERPRWVINKSLRNHACLWPSDILKDFIPGQDDFSVNLRSFFSLKDGCCHAKLVFFVSLTPCFSWPSSQPPQACSQLHIIQHGCRVHKPLALEAKRKWHSPQYSGVMELLLFPARSLEVHGKDGEIIQLPNTVNRLS